jgi:hypothetical protein
MSAPLDPLNTQAHSRDDHRDLTWREIREEEP